MGCSFRVILFILMIMGGFVPELGFFPRVQHEPSFAVLLFKGKVLRTNGCYEEALGILSKALKTAENQFLVSGRRDCFNEMGILFWNIGKLEDAESCFLEAMGQPTDLDKYLDIIALHKDGIRFLEAHEYIKATDVFQKGINLSRSISAPEFEVRMQRYKGEAYLALGELDKYFQCNEKTLRLSRAIRHRSEEAKALKNMGIYYLKTHRQEQALKRLEKSLKIFTEHKDHDESIECLIKIGDVYADWGDFEKSFSFFNQALENIGQILNPVAHSEILLNIGLTYRKKWAHYRNIHDLYEALAFSRRALETEGIHDYDRHVLSVLAAIGVIHGDFGQHESALDFYRIMENKKAVLDYPDIFVFLMNKMGQNLMKMGQVDEAIGYYGRAQKTAEACNIYHLIWESHVGMAECYREKNSRKKSLEHYALAISSIENMRSQIPVDIYKTGFSRDKIKAYYGVVNLLSQDLNKSQNIECCTDLFLSVEKAKARAFLESLIEKKLEISVQMRRREMDISSKTSSIINALFSSKLSPSTRGDLKDQLLRAEEEYIRWISETQVPLRDHERSQYQDAVSLNRVQSDLLDEGTALIEYFLGDQRSLIFMVTRHSCRVFPLPPRHKIEKHLKGYMKLISQLPEEPFSLLRASERITEELMFPLFENEDLNNIDNIVIVPDGILHYFPFESLLIPKTTSPEFLVERFSVSYAPSATTLSVLRGNGLSSRHRKMMLAIGNPDYGNRDFKLLPYSRKEIAAISKIFPREQIDIYQKEKATKTLLKSLNLKEYRILHFACHGYVDENFPTRTALVLSSDGKKDDGFLQVRDIYAMRMNAELVVLSACQSGQGRIEYSEGIIGLPRIFFSAGARSVLYSLWIIRDDATALFMRYFYEFLSEGIDTSKALRLTKLKMISTRFAHPHYWAAFVLQGEYSSVIKKPEIK